jgi:RNA polymerase sigma factor (sigma-70 family)
MAKTTGGAAEFPPTQWSLIQRARGVQTAERREAMESLCLRYWKPVYCFVRRAWSKGPEDAQDLTQAFFLKLIEGDALEKVDPARGCFRPYLKTLLRHFAADQHDAVRALKRGGGRKIIPIDGGEQSRIEDCLADPRVQDPDQVFDMAWKKELLDRAVERARQWFTVSDRLQKFQVFEAYDIATGVEPPTYLEVAARFGIKESDVRNALFEVREKIRTEVRLDLAQTVDDPAHLDEEWRELFGAG